MVETKTSLTPHLKHLKENWDTHNPLQQEYARCAASPQYFATRYVYTFDETDKSSKLYPEYPYLMEKVIPEILQEGNAYWPKSQRMVITISFCMVDLWLWLFSDGENIYWTSKNERAVDNGGENSDWNSVAGKMRYMYDRLPTWLKAMALGKAYHSKFLWKKGSIRNLSNSNLITLEAPTSSAGVGIGVTRARVDESASVVNMATIHVNLTMSCRNDRHYISYPLGGNNFFADLHFKKGHYDFRKVEVHWRENPNYDDVWYQEQRKRLTAFFISQRLDISFEESAVGKVWNKFNYRDNVGDVEYLENIPIFLWWDYGFVDSTSVGFVQFLKDGGEDGVKLRVFDWLELDYSDYIDISNALKEMLSKYGVHEKNTKGIQGFGDPQGNTRIPVLGITFQQFYESEGFMIEHCDTHETAVVLETIDTWLGNGWIKIDGNRCEPFIDAMRYWEWPKDRQGRPKPGATQPRHDRFSHAGKAAEYGFTMTCMTSDGKESLKKYKEQSRDVKAAAKPFFNPREF